MYQNEFDKTGKSIADGKRAEDNFVRLFKNKFGVEPIKTDVNKDKYDHIDFIMKVGGHKATVDVKSWKNNEEYVWIELVSYGRLGWLYGKADYIAFENPDEQGFMVVKRESLVDWVNSHCDCYFTNDKSKALYSIYVRYKGKDTDLYDCVTLIPREDLELLDGWVLKK